jgi:hypothetical protein
VKLSSNLEDALALADELQDAATGYLIERALDEARSRQFRPTRDQDWISIWMLDFVFSFCSYLPPLADGERRCAELN